MGGGKESSKQFLSSSVLCSLPFHRPRRKNEGLTGQKSAGEVLPEVGGHEVVNGAIVRECRSLLHQLCRPKGPGLLLRYGPQGHCRLAGAQPTQSQARSPARHAGSFPALLPIDSGGTPVI